VRRRDRPRRKEACRRRSDRRSRVAQRRRLSRVFLSWEGTRAALATRTIEAWPKQWRARRRSREKSDRPRDARFPHKRGRSSTPRLGWVQERRPRSVLSLLTGELRRGWFSRSFEFPAVATASAPSRPDHQRFSARRDLCFRASGRLPATPSAAGGELHSGGKPGVSAPRPNRLPVSSGGGAGGAGFPASAPWLSRRGSAVGWI